ncbi:MAG: Signal recognition particle 19 kDa protein [Candidatus Lokiarchaeum sp. GC14_75]|nr:MAG: Signal recognition particle 19 kDa protein [Candidatus Lokiarchaeum sp. GC14_75]
MFLYKTHSFVIFMRARKPFLIFWPQYFDGKRSRGKGRRLPKKLAIDKVSTKDIVKAARRLGYKADVEQNYKYSRTWWDDPGRVVIDAKGKKKSKVLLEVAKEMRKSQIKA